MFPVKLNPNYTPGGIQTFWESGLDLPLAKKVNSTGGSCFLAISPDPERPILSWFFTNQPNADKDASRPGTPTQLQCTGTSVRSGNQSEMRSNNQSELDTVLIGF